MTAVTIPEDCEGTDCRTGFTDGHPFDAGTCGVTLMSGLGHQMGWRLIKAPGDDGDTPVDTVGVWWTDYVANDWTEWYADLPTALARLSLLLAAAPAEPDGEFRWFRHLDADAFTAAWAPARESFYYSPEEAV